MVIRLKVKLYTQEDEDSYSINDNGSYYDTATFYGKIESIWPTMEDGRRVARIRVGGEGYITQALFEEVEGLLTRLNLLN